MVTNITSFGRSGLSDWLMQRVSAVILALYTVFIVAYLLFNPNLDYYTWSGLFEQTWIVFSRCWPSFPLQRTPGSVCGQSLPITSSPLACAWVPRR